MKKHRLILSATFVFALTLICIYPKAFAADFIYKLKDDAVMPMSADGESDYLAFGMYTTDNEEMLKELFRAGVIEFYEPNWEVVLCDETSDVYFENQRGYEYKLTNALGAVNNRVYDGRGVKVGIIDTGIADSHPDFDYSRIAAKRNVYNEVNNPSNAGDVTDTVGHGTAVAGIMGAVTDNGIGTASLAGGADYVIIKAFADNSSSTHVSYLISGIDYALSQGCGVINMSVGTKRSSTKDGNELYNALKTAVDEAEKQGAIVVAAAGNHTSDDPNDMTKDSEYMYPASFDNVVSVGAVDENGEIAAFSYHNDKVNVTACGSLVWLMGGSMVNSEGKTVLTPSTGYRRGSGTSYSSPFIAAVAAIMKQIDPDMTVTEFIELIDETSTDRGDSGKDTFFGSGIVNVGKMMDKVLGINITVGTLRLDEEDNYLTKSVITNNGFDSYEIWDLWYMDGNGSHSKNEINKVTLAPRSAYNASYLGFYTVNHLVWLGDALTPLCKKQSLETDSF